MKAPSVSNRRKKSLAVSPRHRQQQFYAVNAQAGEYEVGCRARSSPAGSSSAPPTTIRREKKQHQASITTNFKHDATTELTRPEKLCLTPAQSVLNRKA